MQKQQGKFTLIELMVVIAIIAILAAILLPALQRTKEMAKSITCVNNEKQINLCFVNYVDDFNGRLPMYSRSNWPTGQGSSPYPRWTEIMADYLAPAVYKSGTSYYIKGNSFLMCPSLETPDPTAIVYPGYGMNRYGIGGDSASAPKKYYQISDVKYPSEQVEFGDSIFSLPLKLGNAYVDFAITYNHFRHNKLSNIVFCDGHVEPVKSSFCKTDLAKAPWGNP